MAIEGSHYRFGHFTLDAEGGELRADGHPRPLNPRALKLLQLLVRNHGQLVTKDQIMDHVWEGLFVEENNLAVQISALRKALGDGPNGQPYIVNVPGQGYRFVAAVNEGRADAQTVSAGETVRQARRRRMVIAVAAALAVAVFAAIVGLYRIAGRETVPRLSIAVLPFRNLSSDPEQTYLADAISDDLTTDLTHIPGSFVIARESADTYRDRSVTAQQVGKELGVRYMLEGSVRPTAGRLLINAQLIDTANGAHLWAERFDTARAEMAEAQADIVRRIAGALSFSLVQIEGQRSAADRPKDPDALDLFFRARSMLDRDRSAKGLDAAQPLLEKAVALRPDFGDALDALSWVLLRRATDANYSDEKDWSAAKQLVARARAINPRDADALANQGQLLLIDGNCAEAVSSFRSAISLDRGNILARDGLGMCGDILGHPEEMERAMHEILTLSPEDPGNADRYGHLGMALLMLDRPAEALEWLQKAESGLSKPPERFERGLIQAYAMTDGIAQARERFQAYNRLWPHRSVWRESCYCSKAQSSLPGLKRALAGLQAAGMPEFANEQADDGVKPVTELQPLDFYAAVPTSVPGALTVSTEALPALLAKTPAPVLFDVGCGKAVISGAIFIPWAEDGDSLTDETQDRLAKEVAEKTGQDRTRPIVVMGSGIYGWGPYNVVLRILALGYRTVYWYRGGEEAAAAAHMEAQDLRNP